MADRQPESQKKAPTKSRAKMPVLKKQKTLLDMFALKIQSPSRVELEPIVISSEPTTINEIEILTLHDDVIDLVAQEEAENVLQLSLNGPSSPICVSLESSEPVEILDLHDVIQPNVSVNTLNDTETEPKGCIRDDASPVGKSRSKPIVIDSSPIKPFRPPLSLKDAGVDQFFVPKVTLRTAQKLLQKAPISKHFTVPYPNRESQHVRGVQSPRIPFNHPKPNTRVKQPRAEINIDPGYDFLVSGRDSSKSHSQEGQMPHTPAENVTLQDYVQTIPRVHITQHPAIARMVDRSISGALPTTASSFPWTEMWRPRCAQEVLGNEASAKYLQNWMRAVQSHLEPPKQPSSPQAIKITSRKSKEIPNRGQKRARVITTVDRMRSRKRAKTESDEEEDSWIVDDEEVDDNESCYNTDADLDVSSSPPPSFSNNGFETDTLPATTASADPDMTTQDFGELHNTILLCGPPGTGKTASVYACAEELGWEVFEVYPGIGKRNGANIENLIGEVGKNHLVRQKPHGRHDFFTITSPSKRKAIEFDEGRMLADSRSLPPPGIGSLFPAEATFNRDEPDSFGKSLILLDEVDILYKEDSNFWQTVTRVIRDCRRPVICTCNDLSLVPVLDLPLQSILFFEPCPPDVATSYLQGLCSVEGQYIGRNDLYRLYTGIPNDMLGNGTTHADGGKANGSIHDLRRVINMLQVYLTTGFPQQNCQSVPLDPQPCSLTLRRSSKDGSSEEILPNNTSQTRADEETMNISAFERYVSVAESVSFLDSHLSRSWMKYPATVEKDSAAPSNDDESGHMILYEPKRDSSQLSDNCWDMEIQTTVRNILDAPREGVLDSIDANERGLLKTRSDFQKHVGHVVRDVCPRTVWGIAAPHLYTDYMPWIRQIAAADDALEEETFRKKLERGGRRTRNSALSEYVRTLILSDVGRIGLEMSVFS